VYGRERLGPGPQIIAANHVSNFDPLIVGWAAAREIHFLAKEELFRGPRFFAWLIRSWNAWPLRRGAADTAAMRQCSWLLRRRQTLVLFPEGTRSSTGVMASFKPGIGMLAVHNDASVVPALITGVDRSVISYWVDRDFVRRGFRRRPEGPSRISVRFAEPVRPEGFGRDRAGYQALVQEVESRIRELASGE
jgi:1-acyl-sn-glycerol-3-phosphate acyltransferase